MARDPSNILLPPGMQRPMPKLEPFIVTVQYSFRVDAPSPQMAEHMAAAGISFNTRLATAILAHGVQAVEFTREAVEALGFNWEDIQGGSDSSANREQRDRRANQDAERTVGEGSGRTDPDIGGR